MKDISRSLLESEDGTIGICYAQSHPYVKKNSTQYWFGLHDHQVEFLDSRNQGYLTYHCVDTGLLLVPWNEFKKYLERLGETLAASYHGHWYHIILEGMHEGEIYLTPKAPHDRIDMTNYYLVKQVPNPNATS